MSDVADLLNATLAGKYRVERELGRGGMATVYAAEDLRHGRQVAIKVFRPEIAAVLGVDRFLREIQITARLNHPNILPLIDSGIVGDVPFYVSPIIEGESLRGRIERERQLPLADALRLCGEIADALSHAHALGFVHRDIKPENILLSRGHAIVADFGIARAMGRAAGDRLTDSGLALGTPTYMSPEQATGGGDLDARSDVYSLGCVLYEMLAGEPPFAGPSAQAVIARHISERVPSIRVLRPAIPMSVEVTIHRALAKSPADRFVSVRHLADALVVDAPTEILAKPVSVARPNRGPLVARLCDRWRQVNEFEAFLRLQGNSAADVVRLCIVHGAEGAGHGSFVERVTATRIQPAVEARFGTEGASIRRVVVPWPTDGDFEVRKVDLIISLFREIDPRYLGEDLSITQLAGLPALALAAGVVVEHDLRSNRWDATAEKLLLWYGREFWGALPASNRRQSFFVFFKMMYESPELGLNVARLLGTHKRRAEQVRLRLDTARRAIASTCPCTMLEELSTVTIDDVKDWFAQNQIHDSEHHRQKLAEQIFGGERVKPMATVEHALERIHRAFLDGLALEKVRVR